MKTYAVPGIPIPQGEQLTDWISFDESPPIRTGTYNFKLVVRLSAVDCGGDDNTFATLTDKQFYDAEKGTIVADPDEIVPIPTPTPPGIATELWWRGRLLKPRRFCKQLQPRRHLL